jgi:hypothetical protein
MCVFPRCVPSCFPGGDESTATTTGKGSSSSSSICKDASADTASAPPTTASVLQDACGVCAEDEAYEALLGWAFVPNRLVPVDTEIVTLGTKHVVELQVKADAVVGM